MGSSSSASSSHGGAGAQTPDNNNNRNQGNGKNASLELVRGQRAEKKGFAFDRSVVTLPVGFVKVAAPSKADAAAWEMLGEESRKQCVKSLVRVCLLKAAHKESLSRTKVTDVLKEMSKDYSKCTNSVMRAVQMALEQSFGYSLALLPPAPANSSAAAAAARGVPSSSSSASAATSDYVVFNSLHSPQLQHELAEASPNAAYMGFVFVVLHCINSQPGASTDKVMDQSSLMQHIRELDPRFPETLSSGTGHKLQGGLPVPELGGDFLQLMARMEKERYVVRDKEAAATDGDANRVHYKLGSRYYAELGRQQLARSYCMSIDEPVDMGLLRAAVREEEEAYGKTGDSENVGEGEQQPEQAQAAAAEAAATAANARPARGGSRLVKEGKAQAQDEEEEGFDEEAAARPTQQRKRCRS